MTVEFKGHKGTYLLLPAALFVAQVVSQTTHTSKFTLLFTTVNLWHTLVFNNLLFFPAITGLSASMAHEVERDTVTLKRFGFQSIRIYKHENLGTGSFGAVCKATCDELLCAAKILHPILFQFSGPGAVTTRKRFEQECQFLREISHPHIVQYLGITHDRETGLPVLLMELMEGSLTNFLDRSQTEPVCYHVQVDISYDIALALAYLHTNGIVHRDLSSNNVLLNASCRAKVTDFGMSKLVDANTRLTPLTQCPGTQAYMSPESLEEPPVYTNKLDCFSHGVLSIQIMTRQFPDPGPRTQKVADPRSPVGVMRMPVLETERRKSHIVLINPDHPLLSIGLKCLRFNEDERPSASELCNLLAGLKKAERYTRSVLLTREQTAKQQRRNTEGKERQSQDLSQQQERELLQELQDKEQQIKLKDDALAAKHQEVQQLQQELNKASNEAREKDALIDVREKQVEKLKQQLRNLKATRSSGTTQKKINLKWKEYPGAPSQTYRGFSVVDTDTTTVFICMRKQIHAYNWQNKEWSRMPDCPHKWPPFAVINGQLTAVGGELSSGEPAPAVLSLVGDEAGKKWEEHLPPLLTTRNSTVVIFEDNHLVVIGGKAEGRRLAIVEVMNTQTFEWLTAASLPHPLSNASGTVSEGVIYLTGLWNESGIAMSVLTCSLSALIESCVLQPPHPQSPSSLWLNVADTPVCQSTCVTLDGQILAVGGCDIERNPTDAVHMYDPITDTWHVISRMSTPRRMCLAMVLPENRLMVVGGKLSNHLYSVCNIVEVAKCE